MNDDVRNKLEDAIRDEAAAVVGLRRRFGVDLVVADVFREHAEECARYASQVEPGSTYHAYWLNRANVARSLYEREARLA